MNPSPLLNSLPLFDWSLPPTDSALPHILARLQSLNANASQQPLPSSSSSIPPLRLQSLGNPFDFPGVREAASQILQTIRQNGEIVIFGDFDADGITATAILTDTLRFLGANVRPFIPFRSEGYGLNDAAVSRCLNISTPALLITVDCGMGATASLQRFLDCGSSVIVSDHHIPGAPLPPACTIVSTHTPGVPPFSADLCGAGVSFKIACGTILSQFPLPSSPSAIEARRRIFSWLDALAIATIADVVPLRFENRLIASLGIKLLEKTSRPGLKALVREVMPTPPTDGFSSFHLGFVFAPHINAAGRMADANIALNLLLASDDDSARLLAIQLKSLNVTRKSTSDSLLNNAEDQLSAHTLTDLSRDAAITVSGSNWPAGVIGLVAGHLCEKYRRPVAVISTLPDGSARGSVRAPSGYNAHALLSQCSQFLDHFGGHEGAAGLSLSPSQIPSFHTAFANAAFAQVNALFVRPSLNLEGSLSNNDLDLSLLDLLSQMEPFGAENSEPVWLLSNVSVKASAIGSNKNTLALQLSRDFDSLSLRAIWFGKGNLLPLFSQQPHWDIAGSLFRNSWNGETSIELRVIDARPSSF